MEPALELRHQANSLVDTNYNYIYYTAKHRQTRLL